MTIDEVVKIAEDDMKIMLYAVEEQITRPSPFLPATPESLKVNQYYRERYNKLLLRLKQKYRKRPIKPYQLP